MGGWEGEGGRVSVHKYAVALSVAYEVRSFFAARTFGLTLENIGHYFWYFNKVEIVAITGPVKLTISPPGTRHHG